LTERHPAETVGQWATSTIVSGIVPVSELDWPQDLYARDVTWCLAPDRAGVCGELARLGVDPAALDVPGRVGYPFDEAPKASFA
jgi:hypothetical protein